MSTPLLVTTSQYACLLHPGRRGRDAVEVLHRKHGRYMGASWDERSVYIVATGNFGPSPSDERILVFEAGRLQGAIPLETEDAHDLVTLPNGRPIICDTGRDQLIRLPADVQDRHRVYRLPAEGLTPKRSGDRHHVNTILPGKMAPEHPELGQSSRHAWVLVMNGDGRGHPRQSQLWSVKLADPIQPIRRLFVGHECHSLAILGNNERALTCSSADELLVEVDLATGWRLRARRVGTGCYPRGIAIVGEHVFVGASGVGTRATRHRVNAAVYQYRLDTFEPVARYPLPGAGQVYTVRSTAGDPLAHHGRPFPWRP